MIYRRIKFICLSGVIFILLFTLFANLFILRFQKNIIFDINSVGVRPVALVFGGGMKPDGKTMSEMQTDRVIQGVNLYKAGKVQKLLMTGDDGGNNADEVDAMEAYAISLGVPDENVDIDPHGYNTYKSCERAKSVYGLESIIAVSQEFHLPRIIYFCSREGIDVLGSPADLRSYGFWQSLWPQGIRESLARVKAVVSGKSSRVGNFVVN